MKNSEEPLISLITINFNSTRYTLELLRSISQNPYKNIEVIVVDNASTNPPEKEIKYEFPTTKFIQAEKNLGFAGGNNLGLKIANGEFIFIVNNDTELTESLLYELLDTFNRSKKAGLVSPKIIFHGTNIIQYAGSTPLSITGRNYALGYCEEDSLSYQSLIETAYGHGAAMMVPKEVLEKVGGLPEEYFLYYEELDWCEMIRKKGFKILTNQSAVIFHKESMSIGKDNPIKTYYLIRNRILFVRRNFSYFRKIVFMLHMTFIGLPKNILINLLKGKYLHAKQIIKGFIWNIENPSELTRD